MTEPTNKELLERLRKIDAVVSSVAGELAEQRADIEEMREVISLMNERFKSIESYMRRERDSCFQVHEVQYERMMMVLERVLILEQKVFPKMWPMIGRVESVVGNFDEVHESNPLDRRKEKP